MKLPSIAQIGEEYGRTFQRFPLTLISAMIGTASAVVLIEQDGPSESVLYKILLSSILALPLLTALKLAAERESAGSGRGRALPIVGVALLIAYSFVVPADLPDAPLFHLFRFLAFGAVCCLLFLVLPFRRKGEENGFWQFNKLVVFRLILAGVFAAVLFAGLGLALGALDNLFGIDIPPRRFGQLWALINGLFTVSFVLAGIPDDLDALEGVTDYPKALRVFGQYVLSPLVLIYSVILYAYIAKITITWSWPQGWVGRLILGFSGTGILALFVLDPIREKLDTLWIRKASRWYYLILLPLVVVLFLALWRRISEYGLTEGRYLGLALGVWLVFIAGYFLLSRSRSIKMIPASLCVFAFAVSLGPWGMFSLAENSQVQRLKTILTAESILVDGTVRNAPAPVSEDNEVQISAILAYLHEVHGFSEIEPWFTGSLRPDSSRAGSRFEGPAVVAELLGVEFTPYGGPGRDNSFSVFIDPLASISISGYDHMVRARYGGPPAVIDPTAPAISSQVETTPDSVVVRFTADSAALDSLVIPLGPLFDRVVSTHAGDRGSPLPGDRAAYEYETVDFDIKIVVLQAHFQQQDSVMVARSYDALIFYSGRSDR